MTDSVELMRLAAKYQDALDTLPMPHDGQPHRLIATRPYSSTWRKSSKHWDAMLELEKLGAVERKESRGETLWRLTRPLGHELARRATEKDQ